MAATITYESALATLEAMFPMCDRSIIGLVLQQNRGHMENTVEHLMQLSGSGGGAAGSRAAPRASAAPGGAQPQPKPKPAAQPQQPPAHKEPSQPAGGGSGIQIQPSQPSAEVKHPAGGAGGVAVNNAQRSAAPVAVPVYSPKFSLTGGLPDDFLRPPSYFRHVGPTQSSQLDRDAQLALQLQQQSYQQAPLAAPAMTPQQLQAARARAAQQSANRVASDAEIAAAAGGDAALAAYRAAQDGEARPKARQGEYESL